MKYLKGFAIFTLVILILCCFKFYDQQLPTQPQQDNIELYD
ncbi:MULTISPECIES: hypothetical protein [Acinetobacter]|nr:MULTISPECIES: hypothetical protein [Acinetobacter]EXH35686.1 putative lipoprotein [Acinetobacter sp. 1245249]EYT24529.1 putative lipoprotein [Acinetobacter sp. 1564232]MCU4470082.1 hypothetical protein [Acinetobacter pittii]MCU4484810.1 hypothetical protein [Acinetobacter pittii]MDR3041309.1 hypothetical protein [Acinetobacter pittii]